MSDKPAKTFVNGAFFRARKFDNGGQVLSMDINLKDFFEFAKTHKDDKGFLRIDIKEKNPDNIKEGGNTHYAELNTWKPKEAAGGNSSAKPAAKREKAPEKTPAPAPDEEQPPF